MEHDYNILIVEDNPTDAVIVELLCKQLGIGSKFAKYSNAASALHDIASGTEKGIIILDLHMPGMDGFEFVESFEKLPDDIRNNNVIILTTSSVDPYDIEKGSSYESVKYFINKPLNKVKLLDVFSGIES